jgi:hypothetical protein
MSRSSVLRGVEMVSEPALGHWVIEAAPSRSGVRAHRKLMTIMVNGSHLSPLIAVWRELPWWTTMLLRSSA